MRSSTDLIIQLEAQADLSDIYQYTQRAWNEQQADGYEALIHRAFQRIRLFPEIGRVATDDDPVIREYAVQQHVILYRHDAIADAVVILRVVNPRRIRR